MLVGQSAWIDVYVGQSFSWDRQSGMLVGQSTQIMIRWYVVWSVNPYILAGMLVSQSTLTDRLVCWLVNQPG